MTTDAHGQSLTNSYADFGYYWGEKITPNSNITLTKVTKHASSGATTCRIYLVSDGSQLATASFSSNEATFSLSLSSGVEYGIGCGGGTRYQNLSGAAYPVTSTNVTWRTGGYHTGGVWTNDANAFINVVSVNSTTLNVTFNASTLTLSTTEESPVYLITAPLLSLSNNLNLLSVDLSCANIFYTIKEKELKTSWDSLTATDPTKRVGHITNLIPTKSYVSSRKRVGF